MIITSNGKIRIGEYGKVEESREPKSLDLDELLKTDDKKSKKNHQSDYYKQWAHDKAQISFRVPMEFKAQVEAHVETKGEKLSNFYVRALKETMERDNKVNNQL